MFKVISRTMWCLLVFMLLSGSCIFRSSETLSLLFVPIEYSNVVPKFNLHYALISTQMPNEVLTLWCPLVSLY